MIYTPTNFELDHAPDSTFLLVTRQPKTTNFMFQKLHDPGPPFGMNRSPPHHFITRLREFPPNLQDALFIGSTASGDVGMFVNSTTALSSDPAAAKAINTYTTVSMANDARRAQLPVNDEMSDTSPIGLVLDLSSKENVKRPMPAEEIDASTTPLPGLLVLNNDGVLSSWWFVYSESVRQGTPCPGLVAAPVQTRTTSSHSALPFGSWGQPPSSLAVLVTPSAGIFGATFSAPSFGQSSTPSAGVGSAFGGMTALDSAKSTWGPMAGSSGAPQTAGSAFGKPSQIAPITPFGGGSFGQAGGLGNRASPWASQNAPKSPDKAANPFSSAVNTVANQNSSPFGNLGTSHPSAPAAFSNWSTSAASNSSPLAALGQQQQKSIFATNPITSAGPTLNPLTSFGSTVTIGSSMNGSFGQPSNLGSIPSTWGTPALSNENSRKEAVGASKFTETEMTSVDMDTDTISPQKAPEPSAEQSTKQSQGLFGLGSQGFRLGSTMKGDGSAKNDLQKSDGNSLFGTEFTDALGATEEGSATPIKKEPKSPKFEPLSFTPTSPTNKAGPPVAGGFVQKTAELLEPTSTTPTSPTHVAGPPLMGGFVQNTGELLEPPSTTPTSPTRQAGPPLAGGFIQKVGESQPFLPPAKGKKIEDSSHEKRVEVEPESAPLNPDPTAQKSKKESDPASLPSSPNLSEASQEDINPSPAGSPPVDLGIEVDSPFSSAQSVTSEEGQTQEVDDAPLPPPTIPPKAKWNFALPLPEPSTTKVSASKQAAPKSPTTSKIPLFKPGLHTPPTAVKPSPSKTPKSSIFPPSYFPRPVQLQESPRSPSPIRNERPPSAGHANLRSPSPPRNQPARVSTTPTGPPPVKAAPFPLNSRTILPPPRLAPVDEVRSEPSASEADGQYLSDDEDERIREELAEPISPTKKLAPFLAHQDYVGNIGGSQGQGHRQGGIPTQIEMVYRDINSMIDTLGLNARSLKSFVKGHSEMVPDGGRDRDHLEKEKDWCLMEIEDLKIVQKNLAEKLEAERPQNVRPKLEELLGMQKELAKLRARNADVVRQVEARTNPEKLEDARQAPLTTEQGCVLSDLRREFAAATKLLGKTEDALGVLKAQLVSIDGAAEHKVPTVEAVIKTIEKMTRMAEGKSGDVDLLEAQMRKLKFRNPVKVEELDFGGLSLNGRGRSATPLATPVSSRKKVSEGTYALQYDESGRSRESSTERLGNSLKSSLHSSRGGKGERDGKGGKVKVTEGQVREYRRRKERRDEVLGLLKEKVMERGVRITN